MGNKPSSESSSSKEEILRREQLEKNHGVLIPPRFGVTAPSGSPSMRDRLPVDPSLWALLHATDLSYAILNDYMKPGVWISGQDSDVGRFRASFTGDHANKAMSDYVGRVFLERQAGAANLAQLRVGSKEIPSISTAHHVYNGVALFGHLSTQGSGWFGAMLDKNWHVARGGGLDDDVPRTINTKFGAWLYGRAKVIDNGFASADSLFCKTEEVNAYAAVNVLGALAAFEAKLPLANESSLDLTTRSYFSMDLKGDETTGGIPLHIALEKTESVSTMSLSQQFSFDRLQFNPVEDRAPRVLNRAGWTVRMEHDANDDDNDNNNKTLVTLGGAWQLNRGLALKVAITPTSLTTGVILKRWNQPRVTASLLFQHEPTKPARFLGLGVEMEMGSSSAAAQEEEDVLIQPSTAEAAYVSRGGSRTGDGTETKVVLPRDL